MLVLFIVLHRFTYSALVFLSFGAVKAWVNLRFFIATGGGAIVIDLYAEQSFDVRSRTRLAMSKSRRQTVMSALALYCCSLLNKVRVMGCCGGIFLI
jgi:hypothetical protein